ncbi:hypothetical protein SAMN05518846_103328 [Brevibacillus centrosporus]|uniref:Uncharacterized protein n=1 Tax=Brevibacillus centrosporus TaxID=54910 RepID=A0A1I3RAA2_9BACL|nr:hypothetical protein SAMN05518846_103328 [Brevibacillus centrosporus]
MFNSLSVVNFYSERYNGEPRFIVDWQASFGYSSHRVGSFLGGVVTPRISYFFCCLLRLQIMVYKQLYVILAT